MVKHTGWKQKDMTHIKLRCPFCGNEERNKFTPYWDESDDRECKYTLFMHCHLCAHTFEKIPRWTDVIDKQGRI